MKTFLLWLLVTLGAFAGLGASYHVYLEQNPRKVLVVVDSSFPMRRDWPHVATLLGRVDDGPYRRYGLLTEKARIHGWSSILRLGSVSPYAPRNFDRLRARADFPEIAEADEIVLVTNATEAELEGLPDWRILQP